MLEVNSERRRCSYMFIIPSLERGGAESLTVSLVNKLLESGFLCTVILIRTEGELLARLLPSARIKVIGASRLLTSIFAIRREIRRERPSVVVGLMWPVGFIVWMASLGFSGIKIVYYECTNLSEYLGKVTRVQRLMVGLSHNLADKILCVSEGVRNDLIRRFGVEGSKLSVLYPAVDVRFYSSCIREKFGHTRTRILTVGRLIDSKNHSLMLRVMQALVQSVPQVTLNIVGNGPKSQEIRNEISALGLAGVVSLYENVEDIVPHLCNSDIFLLTSRYEGFALVLAEAIASGLPVISVNCQSGPSEIVQSDKVGFLVEDRVDSIARAFHRAQNFEFSEDAMELTAARFHINTVEGKFIELTDSM